MHLNLKYFCQATYGPLCIVVTIFTKYFNAVCFGLQIRIIYKHVFVTCPCCFTNITLLNFFYRKHCVSLFWYTNFNLWLFALKRCATDRPRSEWSFRSCIAGEGNHTFRFVMTLHFSFVTKAGNSCFYRSANITVTNGRNYGCWTWIWGPKDDVLFDLRLFLFTVLSATAE
jgi:hypothetical protein